MYMMEVLEPVDMSRLGSSASLGSWARTELTLARMLDNAAFGSVFV